MKHFAKVTKGRPAAAREWGSFPLFGLGPAFWAGFLGYPFQEVGNFVQKWSIGKDLEPEDLD